MDNAIILSLMLMSYWLSLGIVGSALLNCWKKCRKTLFIFSAFGSISLFMLSLLFSKTEFTLALPLGISHYALHFHWDALSAFFIILLSAVSAGVGLFSIDYFSHLDKRAQRILCFNYHWFLASMVGVFLVADTYTFLLAWEFMTLSSYLLIVAVEPASEKNYAGFLYFLVAHLGVMAIFISFTLLSGSAADFAFGGMREAHLSSFDATMVFVLALIGFGAKAGLLPLHVWLPEAHPAAVSPISALMSGVMLKTAVYGMIRVAFDLLQGANQMWGFTMLLLGVLTALLGAILSAMQTDMKRLLAYSSVENMGIIFAGIGLSLLFYALNHMVLAALAMSAALFHCFNHGLFKSLLFLGAGSVLHVTGERNLGKLGGLIKRMPWVAGFVLIGVLALSGVPLLNGFVAEWLLLQAFLFFQDALTPYLTMLIPIAAAVFALVIGLSAYVMVKFYGIIFLGKPRVTQLINATDAPFFERCGLAWLAIGCLVLGLLPWIMLNLLSLVTTTLFGQSTASLFSNSTILFIIPINAAHTSYSPLLFFTLITVVFIFVYALIRFVYGSKRKVVPAWDCGFPETNARMQDTAEGFGQPIKRIFSFFIQVYVEVPKADDKEPQYHQQTKDRFWDVLYFPILRLVIWSARQVTKLQQGRISQYLIYSFLMLLVLLGWVIYGYVNIH